MKRRIKMSIAIIVIMSVMLSTFGFSAAAVQSWTPTEGSAIATRTSFGGSGLRWYTKPGIVGQYWELEARSVHHINEIWGSRTGGSSNLPGFYTEADPDDRSIGTKHLGDIQAYTIYYGTVNLNSGTSYVGQVVEIESEYGDWWVIDGYPISYESLGLLNLTSNVASTLTWW